MAGTRPHAGSLAGTSGGDASGVAAWARSLAESVPAIVAALRAGGEPRLHRAVLSLLERPLLAHALAQTGGNQVHAARLLGLNRNTLRKRCRDLGVAPTARPPAGRHDGGVSTPPSGSPPARPLCAWRSSRHGPGPMASQRQIEHERA